MIRTNRPSYFKSIEDEFGRLRGKITILSPLDGQLVQHWSDSGVPLRLVLSELREGFKKNSNINTLRYFKQPVWNSFESWSAANIGAPSEPESSTTVGYEIDLSEYRRETLKTLIRSYSRTDIPEPCKFVAKKLKLIDAGLGFSQVEEQLKQIDRELSESILKSLSKHDKEIFFKLYWGSRFKLTSEVRKSTIVYEYLKFHNLTRITLYPL